VRGGDGGDGGGDGRGDGCTGEREGDGGCGETRAAAMKAAATAADN